MSRVIRLDDDAFAKLRAIARRRGCSIQDAIAHLLDEHDPAYAAKRARRADPRGASEGWEIEERRRERDLR
jgi:predicted DNA-binding ribbon-helix-helix protein